MNMLAVYLLLPVAAAVALLAGPAVQASINPGNGIMTASNYTFQSDTFSAAGAIGSTAGDESDPVIITGRWSLDVQGGVADFTANLTMVNATGAGYRTVQLSNLSSSNVMVNESGTALVIGMLDVTVNGTEKLSGVNATIALAKLRALNLTMSELGYLAGPVYGTADPPRETATASNLVPEGSGIYGNITEKFRLPQLPNPFR
jgi:hypothetical protein